MFGHKRVKSLPDPYEFGTLLASWAMFHPTAKRMATMADPSMCAYAGATTRDREILLHGGELLDAQDYVAIFAGEARHFGNAEDHAEAVKDMPSMFWSSGALNK